MKNNKILKFLLPIALVLIIFAIIGKKQGWFGKALTVKVAVENAEKRVIIETITANGKIQPEKEVKISPDVSGEIVELT
ncbi:MAG: efflux RND transporter periplasmic adaptor subunit, partial [Bacteroidetes bacterium]|nr:efflux RND transporter periplasmic adaptor subunit [Bacteroidota bacterium]